MPTILKNHYALYIELFTKASIFILEKTLWELQPVFKDK